MSIQTQIDRINQAKADILTALTEKGVDTTGAELADIAALVAAIESGGSRVTEGTFVPDGTIKTPYTIEHGLGVIPRLFVIYSLKTQEYSSMMLVGVIYPCWYYDNRKQIDLHVYADSGYNGVKEIETSSGTTLTAENVVIQFDQMGGYAGYGWFAIA